MRRGNRLPAGAKVGCILLVSVIGTGRFLSLRMLMMWSATSDGTLPKGPYLVYQLLPSCFLLAWNIGCGDDRLMWIDKERSENLSMPGFRRVRQAEWTDSVLHRVWECQETSFAGDDFPELLFTWPVVMEAVNFLYGADISLIVGEIHALTYLLAKC